MKRQLTELSRQKMASYVRAAATDKADKAWNRGYDAGKGNYSNHPHDKADPKRQADRQRKEKNRFQGIFRATRKLAKEETEVAKKQIDEISRGALRDYVSAASVDDTHFDHRELSSRKGWRSRKPYIDLAKKKLRDKARQEKKEETNMSIGRRIIEAALAGKATDVAEAIDEELRLRTLALIGEQDLGVTDEELIEEFIEEGDFGDGDGEEKPKKKKKNPFDKGSDEGSDDSDEGDDNGGSDPRPTSDGDGDGKTDDDGDGDDDDSDGGSEREVKLVIKKK